MTNQYAKRILKALINGTHLSEQNAYSALQNEDVKGALNYALGAIDVTQKVKVPFSLSKEEKAQIKIDPEEYLGVQKIASRINKVLTSNGQNITGSEINLWLTQKGVLEDNFHNGKADHRVTDYGKQCGAKSTFDEERFYWHNTYPASIVYKVIDHTEEIISIDPGVLNRSALEALANGINPETGEILSKQNSYDVINAENVKRALKFALSSIDVSEKVKEKKVKRTEPFSLPLEAKKEIQLDANELLPLSKIISRVNKVIPDNCKKLGKREVRQWLVKEEILSEQTINGKVIYNITGYAIHNGVKQVSSKNGGRSYIVYPVEIQKAIIENAEEMMKEFE